MNGKKVNRLRAQANRLAVQTFLAAEEKGLTLKFPNTRRKIYQDLKNGDVLQRMG